MYTLSAKNMYTYTAFDVGKKRGIRVQRFRRGGGVVGPQCHLALEPERENKSDSTSRHSEHLDEDNSQII